MQPEPEKLHHCSDMNIVTMMISSILA